MGWCTILLENEAANFTYSLWERNHLQVNCTRGGALEEEAEFNNFFRHYAATHTDVGAVIEMLH
jgi:hypothetical protein